MISSSVAYSDTNTAQDTHADSAASADEPLYPAGRLVRAMLLRPAFISSCLRV